ncbi:Protein archease [bacterium HR19]|nr:Protein archease [bacterium HR19]
MIEILEHTGEAAFKVIAQTEEEIVKEACKGILAIYFGEEYLREFEEEKKKNEQKPVYQKKEEISADGVDFESALVNFLNEIIFRFDARKLVLKEVENIKITKSDETEIKATAIFEKFDPQKHKPKIYVKAATYGGLQLKKTPDGKLEIQIIVDI